MNHLKSLYAGFDWYYEHSDDHSVWARGSAQWQAICREERRLMLNERVTLAEIEKLRSQFA